MYQDNAISSWVLENISKKFEFIDKIAKFLSNFTSWGQLWILIMIVIMIYEYIKTKKVNFHFLICLLPVIFGWYLSDYHLKNWVERPRPYQEITGFLEIMDTIGYKHPSGYSFPSGHTLIAFASSFILISYNKKYGYCAYALSALIAMSRIILGAHYLSDVIAGMGIGTVIGMLAILLSKKLSPKLNDWVNKKIGEKHEAR